MTDFVFSIMKSISNKKKLFKLNLQDINNFKQKYLKFIRISSTYTENLKFFFHCKSKNRF